MSKAKRLDGWAWIAMGVLLFLLLFLLYPTLKVVWASLAQGSAYREFFAKPYYYDGLITSLWLSAAATVGSVLLGVPLALLVARYNLPLKGLIRVCAVLSLLSPPFIGAYAWVILLGRSGLIPAVLGLEGVSIYGPGGVLLVFILHHFAYPFLLTTAALQRIDPALEEAAETLGSAPWRRLFSVTLPLAFPAIAAGALLVFITTLADFGTPMLIGEGMRTLPVLAYNEFLSELGGNPGMASAVSFLMLLVALAALGLQAWMLGGRSYAMQGLRPPRIQDLPLLARMTALLFALLVSLFAILPQIVVLVSSFLKTRGPLFTGEFSLQNYGLMVDRLLLPIRNTLFFAGAATLIMLGAGLLIGYVLVRRVGPLTRLLDGLLVLAQVLPGAVLGIGLVITWGQPPVRLHGTAAILIIAFIIRRIAYTVRASAAGLKQLSPSLEEASLTLGASPARTFRLVTLPLLLPAALSGALVSWVSTLSELSSSIMLYTGRTTTVSIQIYNQVMADSFGTAAAMASVLTVLTLGSLWALRRWTGEQDGLQL